MDRIASHERLLEALRQRIFVPLDVVIPLRFRRAPYEDRSTAALPARAAEAEGRDRRLEACVGL